VSKPPVSSDILVSGSLDTFLTIVRNYSTTEESLL
jgi:hypothetical protein